ncbi:MAG: hypothetical protein Kow0081_3450 [Candidatus Dojkabacteria bacterium]
MKKYFRPFLKYLLVFLYPVIVIGAVVLGVMLFMRENDIRRAMNAYENIYDLEQITGEPKDGIINAMKDAERLVKEAYQLIDQKNKEISDLNDKIQKEKKVGYGEITGSVAQLVFSTGNDFNQYQRVCAQTVSNPDKQYCVSVAAVQREYSLVVPEGEYYIFAQLQDGSLPTAKAYYTEFVLCSRGAVKQESECNPKDQSKNNIVVTVTNGQVVENIDPIDWNNIDTEAEVQEKPAI